MVILGRHLRVVKLIYFQIQNVQSCALSQALLGYLLFQETLSRTWWAGTACITLGICLIGSDQAPDSNQAKKED